MLGSSPASVEDPRGSVGPAPLAPNIFFNRAFFQAILRENPYFEHFGLRAPWG